MTRIGRKIKSNFQSPKSKVSPQEQSRDRQERPTSRPLYQASRPSLFLCHRERLLYLEEKFLRGEGFLEVGTLVQLIGRPYVTAGAENAD